MRLAPLALLVFVANGPAFAHGPLLVTPDDVWRAWTFDPWVFVPLFAAHWTYGRGLARLWSKTDGAHGLLTRRAIYFVLGEAALVAALVSPIDGLSGMLLSAHMVQHALLVAVAPPLLLLAAPGAVMAWTIPRAIRRGLARSRPLRRALSILIHPLIAAALHGLALWLWHAPIAFDAANQNEWLHAAEHACFFLTALLFWAGLFEAERNPALIGFAFFAAFATFMHSGFLGALLSFAGRPFYGWYEGRTALWGMTAMEDQQLAGLLMWVPVGPAYLIAGLILVGRLVAGTFEENVGSNV